MEEWSNDVIKMLVSIGLGSLLGIEREYKNKSAGFRTIVLICLGATVFTIISYRTAQDASHDRIAANIITGIGFIGAGVIFKEGLSVTGLTTAAIIWVAAALGMAIGRGDYTLAVVLSMMTLFIQTAFHHFENWLEKLHHRRKFRLTFADSAPKQKEFIEDYLLENGIRFKWDSVTKTDGKMEIVLDVRASLKKVEEFSLYLSNQNAVESFR